MYMLSGMKSIINGKSKEQSEIGGKQNPIFPHHHPHPHWQQIQKRSGTPEIALPLQDLK